MASGSTSNHKYVNGACSVCGAMDPGTVVMVGNVGYATLEEAITAANGQEIKLQKNLTIDALTITKDAKINLNGNLLYIKNTAGAASAITVNSGNTLEIYNGQLRVISDNTFTALIENNGTLVVTDVIIRDTGLGGENPVTLLNNGTATITGTSAVVAATKTDIAIVNKGTCTVDIVTTEGANARIQGVIQTVEGGLSVAANVTHYGKTEIVSAK